MQRTLLIIVAAAAVLSLALGAGALAGGATALWLTQRSAALPVIGASHTVVDRLSASMPTTAGGGDDLAVLQAVRAARPAVVTIWNMQTVRDNYTTKLVPATSGSGVVFDPRGYIATNTHVLQGAESISVVFLNGQRADAKLVNFDPRYDVAILKVDPSLVSAVAPLADSGGLEPGMRVLAIGSPLGTDYQNTVTTGIIAGLNRRVKESRFDWYRLQYREEDVVAVPLIQTDAAINSGNSGGPLVNLRGEVVGLNTLIVRNDGQGSTEGLGFAIPSNVIRALADEWVDGHRLGALGVEFETVDPMSALEQNLARGTGALVTAVQAGSSAERAGLAQGDLITGIDGVTLDVDHALADVLWRYRSGDTVTLAVERAGKPLRITVPLDTAPTRSQ